MFAGAIRTKLGAVPMHRWVADVYEGAPSGAGTYFAVVPKRVMLMRRVRLGMTVEIGTSTDMRTTMRQIVAMRTMSRAAMVAVRQRRWKRRVAYIGILNVGQMRVGVLVGTVSGRYGRRVYIGVYMLMTWMTWARFGALRVNGRDVKYLSEAKGRGDENPVRARTRMVRVRSMAGMPPRAGFFGKMLVYRSAVQEGWILRAVVGVLSGVIGAFNYLRRIKLARFESIAIQPVVATSVREVWMTKERARAIGRGRGRRRLRRMNPAGRREAAWESSRAILL